MSGIGLLLSTAKDALLAQQLALDVVSHNIANVNTPGYSRQIPHLTTRQPAPYAGMMLGRGVDVEEVIRNTDAFIETRLQQRKTDLTSLKEQEVYMGALEAIFNENSKRSLSTLFSEFWNAWHDLANNPTGASERKIVFERASLLCQSFSGLHADLTQLTDQLNLSLQAGVSKINEITAKIADLNQQILAERTNGNPNDLLDKRNQLITDLSEYMDIRYYENDDGSLTVTTGRGYVLVTGSDYYELSYDDGAIRWESSGGANRDITDTITGGKMGGWLDMRDETIPEYEADLNELAKSLIWEVNRVHTQGAGTERFTNVTGSYAVTNSAAALDSSGLDFQDKIVDGSFQIWIYDSNGNVVGSAVSVNIDADVTSLNNVVTSINSQAGGNLTASVNSAGKLVIQALSGCTFAFANDTSGALAALGINTFFVGSSPTDHDYARFIDVNSVIEQNKGFIAAAKADSSTGVIASGDNSNALDMTDLPYTIVDMTRYHYERGTSTPSQESVSGTMEDYLHGLVGSVGIKSQSVSRSREYTEVIVNQLEESRDNISAVSIDEEMTNIIKYQHAYTAAAKLISTGDEMFRTLLELK